MDRSQRHDRLARRALPLGVALLAMAATCSGLDNIEISAKGSAVIPQRTVLDEILGALSFTGFEGFDLTQSQEFRNQGYTKEQIDSVRMLRFTLTIASPEGADFDFLQSIRFHASAEGLPQVQLAEIDPVPRGVSTVDLNVDTMLELRPYVVAPSMIITTSATGLRPPARTTINAEAVFDVDVNVTGACQ